MHISLLPLLPSLSSLSLLPIPPSLSEVIHPAQVPAVREAFSPSEERIQWASRLISAFNHHQHSGHVSLLHYMQVSWVWLICCFSLVFAFHTSPSIRCTDSLSLLQIPPSLSEVIHPAQVPAVREAFSPSEERVQWASRLISAFNHHQHSGHVSLLHYMQVSWVWLICCFSLVFAFHTSLMIRCLRDLAVTSFPGLKPSTTTNTLDMSVYYTTCRCPGCG